jgi:tetratricopeptide (TPR) repeat protein
LHQVQILLRIYWQPAEAMSAILDRGSLLFASLAALADAFLLGRAGFQFSFYTPLLVLAVFYVPGVLVLGKHLGRVGGGLGDVFQRDYSALLTCTAMAWTAASLPLIPVAWILRGPLLFYLVLAAGLYFFVVMFFVVRTVFGIDNRAAAVAVSLSWIPLVAAYYLWGVLRMVLGWIASPFFLFYAYYLLGGEFRNLGEGLRRRQNFQRMLQAAAVNPHDAEAQYQLGLIYQQRRQHTAAIERFKQAIAIDPKETDAHFQLGRIAREQGRLNDALSHFQAVLDLDDRHSQSEILRELGAMYLSVRQYEHARQMLVDFIDRHPYDVEGLYEYGQALEGLNRAAEAREMYERAVESDRTAPRYRRRITAPWSRLAQKALARVVH